MIREAKQQGVDISGTSLEYLQGVYRGEIKNPDPKRIEAARAAAPYEFPRLTDSTIRQASENDGKTEAELLSEVLASLSLAAAKDEVAGQEVRRWAKEQLGLIDPPPNVIPLQAKAVS